MNNLSPRADKDKAFITSAAVTPITDAAVRRIKLILLT
jgi:hypothetical protein